MAVEEEEKPKGCGPVVPACNEAGSTDHHLVLGGKGKNEPGAGGERNASRRKGVAFPSGRKGTSE